jgi:hypothetical protein
MNEPKGSGISVNGTSQKLAKTRTKKCEVNGMIVNDERALYAGKPKFCGGLTFFLFVFPF